MPSADIPLFLFSYTSEIISYFATLISQRVHAYIHKHTYRSLPSPKPIVIIGGSFSGLYLAFRLAESLPSGYKVVLIEQNSHFNYTFNFPRYAVVEGREERAFVPYEGLFSGMPEGAFELVRGKVVGIESGKVVLEGGREVDFAYLAVATGVSQAPPAKLLSVEKKGACAELKALQERIRESESIAIVGAGAVGVQLATDIKTFQPEKKVTLIHSRERVLSNFGKRLHDFVMGKLEGMGIEVVLGERPVLPAKSEKGAWEPTELGFKDGRKRTFDLVIPCTGQTPNSSLLTSFSPTSISPVTHRLLVNSNLQLTSAPADDSKTPTSFPNIFALGDVAETGGARFARAGSAQAEIVRVNIIALIKGGSLKSYVPNVLEGSMKLSLGKDKCVFFAEDDKRDYLFETKLKSVDLEVAKVWKTFGADLKDAVNL